MKIPDDDDDPIISSSRIFSLTSGSSSKLSSGGLSVSSSSSSLTSIIPFQRGKMRKNIRTFNEFVTPPIFQDLCLTKISTKRLQNLSYFIYIQKTKVTSLVQVDLNQSVHYWKQHKMKKKAHFNAFCWKFRQGQTLKFG